MTISSAPYKRRAAKDLPIGSEAIIGSLSLVGKVLKVHVAENAESVTLILEEATFIQENKTNNEPATVIYQPSKPVEVELGNQRVRYRGLSDETRIELLNATDEELERILEERKRLNGHGKNELGGTSS